MYSKQKKGFEKFLREKPGAGPADGSGLHAGIYFLRDVSITTRLCAVNLPFQ